MHKDGGVLHNKRDSVEKSATRDELDLVRVVITEHPDGIAIGKIEQDRRIADLALSRGTLRNRINRLIDEGIVERRGERRGTRYFPASVRPVEEVGDVDPAIVGHFRIPVEQRPASRYDRTLVEQYVPNESFLLSLEERRVLQELAGPGSTELPAGTYLRRVYDRVLIEFSWASSRLEGNTYSLLETERLLAEEVAPSEVDPTETQMILNHKRAIELLVEQAEEVGFNRYTICNLHALLTENLMPSAQAEGMIRSRPVGIGGSTYQPPSGDPEVAVLLDLLLEKATEIRDPFEASFFALAHIPYLQPFEDGNKRTSRLAANIPFVRANLPPLSFIGIGREYTQALLALYELRRFEPLRTVFVAAYRESARRYADTRQQIGEPDPFRMRYRRAVADLIASIVAGPLDRTAAVERIRRKATELPQDDRDRFTQLVEEELRHLRLSNIARYRIRPGELERWREGWG